MGEEDKKNKPAKGIPPSDVSEESSLEKTSTLATSDMGDSDALERKPDRSLSQADEAAQKPGDTSWREKAIRKLGSINPYLVLFILVIIVGLVIAYIVNRVNEDNDPSNLNFEGSELDQAALDDLLKAEQNIGTVDQTLTVAANAIFNGKILVKSDLDVAGSIRVGGPLNLPGITVAGTSDFDDVNINNNLSILGSASIQQSLTVQGGANISGNVSVGGTVSAGTISADKFEFTGDLNLTRHIDTGGSSTTAVSGTAVGSGGTVSVSGNDIAGTVTINTGGGPPAGIMVRINFSRGYNNTPSVHITPVGSATAGLIYYVDRTTSNFSIGTINAPSGATTYRFDYFVTE